VSADVEEARHRLREWAFYFRDQLRRSSCGSLERNWRSPQCWTVAEPKPDYDFLTAVATHAVLQSIETANFRALTWRYCYPRLALGIPLRMLSKRLGYRLTLRDFDELVAIGEHRVAAKLNGDA